MPPLRSQCCSTDASIPSQLKLQPDQHQHLTHPVSAQVPQYYSTNPPKLSTAHVAKFAQETLFYIFYSMPGDEAQVFAADELCHRGWWFHKEHKVNTSCEPEILGSWFETLSWTFHFMPTIKAQVFAANELCHRG